MMNSGNCYESLSNDRDESSDDGSFKIRRKEKGSLRIRLKRVFSAGSSISPGPLSSLSNSRASSPARSSSGSSPSTKFRYSWQAAAGLAGKSQDARSPQPSPQRSPKLGTPLRPGTPAKLSPTACGDSTSALPSPATPKNLLYAAIWYDETRMKYSPKQQQKERKSESESMNNTTPSRDLEGRTRNSNAGDEDSSGARTASRFSICRRGSSTGMFAWMRVFRLATMLHQVGC